MFPNEKQKTGRVNVEEGLPALKHELEGNGITHFEFWTFTI